MSSGKLSHLAQLTESTFREQQGPDSGLKPRSGELSFLICRVGTVIPTQICHEEQAR